MERLRVSLHGAVQGVGFRPFVYRLATELALNGWVLNSYNGLIVEVEGPPATTAQFLERLETERPPSSVILTREVSRLAPAGLGSFEIRHSGDSGPPSAAILPDLATCPDCLAELRDPGERRYRYPFTNCTRCGPRYTIVEEIPYDRPNTTLKGFPLCADCRREYTNPADRRFHAQPIACPACGPRLDTAIESAVHVIRSGGIVALKGIGGFQLLCDARNAEAVARLRERKHREAKPLAVMMPSLEAARHYCRISAAEEQALRSPAAPIVLLEPAANPLAPNVSDMSPFVAAMLPNSPLHHLLMSELAFPVVATSGNVSGDPIVTTTEEAHRVLAPIADLMVGHNRPIARPVDDSVVRVFRGGVSVIRRARGFAPLPIPVPVDLPPTLAVGGHMKNTVALGLGRQVFVSQHIGDLDTVASRQAFEQAIDDLCRLYRVKPEFAACDLHPEYASTRWAQNSGLKLVSIQHHIAHAASCAAENDVPEPYLAVSWDGTGFGTDHTIWGGEFFWAENGRFERVAHLRPFGLPGGDAAIRQSWRPALSLLWECRRDFTVLHLDPRAAGTVRRMLEQRINCPRTSSIGRLFDAVAALAGVATENHFEGHAAMLLERTADPAEKGAYSLPLENGQLDWSDLVDRVPADPAPIAAARFHNGLALAIRSVARFTAARQVVLSGGVFQNARLTHRTVALLEGDGIRVFTHQRVPANDGGLSLGQAVLAYGKIDATESSC
ncbi:MAG: carbamoyltransferase HypF [Bryobacteraceae bacterium]